MRTPGLISAVVVQGLIAAALTGAMATASCASTARERSSTTVRFAVPARGEIAEPRRAPQAAPAQRIYLTFDAHETTPDKIAGAYGLLDELRSRQIRATLFLTADFIAAARDVVDTAIADGHEIGSHLKTHIAPDVLRRRQMLTETWFKAELLAAGKLLRERHGVQIKPFFRMPFGLGSYRAKEQQKILRWAADEGYVHVAWDVDCYDWVMARGRGFPLLTAEQLSRTILREAERRLKGAVVLSHLTRFRPPGGTGAKEIVAALDQRADKTLFAYGLISDYLAAFGKR